MIALLQNFFSEAGSANSQSFAGTWGETGAKKETRSNMTGL